jgi:hypothetical protein
MSSVRALEEGWSGFEDYVGEIRSGNAEMVRTGCALIEGKLKLQAA